MIDNKLLRAAIEEVLKGKGSRKFKQTVDLSINFRGIDFNKPENRLNIEVPLPKGRGRPVKVAVFADGQGGTDAKKAGADLVLGSEMIEKYAKDKIGLKKLANEYTFLAEPKLMVSIGKSLGAVLGAKGKMPKPFVGKYDELISKARRTVVLRSRGKYMPVINVPVGTEDMSPDDILENVTAVLDAVRGKVSDAGIKNVYLKLTMGVPKKVG
ncbi:MAG: 50S ribosomal protein L1 [Candidatus Micrarchaeota archaeon]|nr:50S ribosomal protein L1 [Candidatus Micrarchaeota archaeon]